MMMMATMMMMMMMVMMSIGDNLVVAAGMIEDTTDIPINWMVTVVAAEWMDFLRLG